MWILIVVCPMLLVSMFDVMDRHLHHYKIFLVSSYVFFVTATLCFYDELWCPDSQIDFGTNYGKEIITGALCFVVCWSLLTSRKLYRKSDLVHFHMFTGYVLVAAPLFDVAFEVDLTLPIKLVTLLILWCGLYHFLASERCAKLWFKLRYKLSCRPVPQVRYKSPRRRWITYTASTEVKRPLTEPLIHSQQPQQEL